MESMIYFDQAATTFPKPQAVTEEVLRCMRDYCGNPGRSSHRLSLAAAEKIFETRAALCALFGADAPERVIFTCNATYALNLAIKSVLSRGDHVLISDFEHNSVYRPVCALAAEGKIRFDVVDAYADAQTVVANFAAKLRPNTRLIAVTHVSNVCGVSLPIRELGTLCKKRGILFLVDASQSAGALPIHMEQDAIDALCGAGHKGLYGPQGTGYLVLSERFAARVLQTRTLIEGGNGYNSTDRVMPAVFPERLEAGTLATPAIAGLCEGIRFVSSLGVEAIGAHERTLAARLKHRLAGMENVILYAPDFTEGGTVLFNVRDVPSVNVASWLDEQGICVRAGFHCAPLAHKRLATGENGAVRVSFGAFNTAAEVDYAADCLERYGDVRDPAEGI